MLVYDVSYQLSIIMKTALNKICVCCDIKVFRR